MASDRDLPELSRLIVVEANENLLEVFHQTKYDVFGYAAADASYERMVDITTEMYDSSWGKDGRFQTWVLVDRDNKQEAYSFAQTTRRDVLVKLPGDVPVQDDVIYAITSLCTPRNFQGNGFAHRLLRILHYICGDPDKLPPMPADFSPIPSTVPGIGSLVSSALPRGWYSTCWVGEEIAQRPGWTADPLLNSELAYNLDPDIATSFPSDETGLSYGSKIIYISDWPEIGLKLSKYFRTQLAKTRNDYITVRPDPASPGYNDRFELLSRNMWTTVGVPRPDPTTIPTGIRFFPISKDRTPSGHTVPPFDPTHHPLSVFIPGFPRDEMSIIPATATINVNKDNLEPFLAAFAERVGKKSLRMSGVNPEDETVSRWIEIGATFQKGDEKMRKNTVEWCWYGREGTNGRLIGI